MPMCDLINSWNINSWQLKKDEKIIQWYTQKPTIQFYIWETLHRKEMSQKKHQLCFAIPKGKEWNVHLIVKKWMTNMLESGSFRELRPLGPQQGFARDPMVALRLPPDPLVFFGGGAYSSFPAWLRPWSVYEIHRPQLWA